MPLLVSIIINNYNYERFLRDAIESAIGQTYPHCEVIVVDDGSQDQSASIIKAYSDVHKIIGICKKNGGQASAMNVGYQASKGDILIFLDADDYLYPQCVQKVVDILLQHQERSHQKYGQEKVAKLQYRLNLVDADNHWIDTYPSIDIQYDSGDVVPKLLETGEYITAVTSGNAFWRDVLQEVMPIPEDEFRISADGYLLTVLPFHGVVLASDDVLGAYRQHGENAWSHTARSAVAHSERYARVLEHHKLRHKYIQKEADARRLSVAKNLGMKNQFYVVMRLCSLVLSPHKHPFPDDNRFALAWYGVWRSLLYRQMALYRRLVWAAWFLALALSPHVLALILVEWMASPRARPRWWSLLTRPIFQKKPKQLPPAQTTQKK